jgi:SRSO17 transposase
MRNTASWPACLKRSCSPLKPQLAGELLRHAVLTGAVAHWVAGDEVHGGAGLRRLIRSLGMGYVMAVRGNHTVTTSPGTTMTVTAAARLLKPRHWQRMRTGSGSKGAKDYYWAILQVKPDDSPGDQAGEHDDGHSCLLLRRHRYTGTISYFRCWSRTGVPLADLIEVAVRRWRIERTTAAVYDLHDGLCLHSRRRGGLRVRRLD